jgi:hypothetical protein
MHYVLYYVYMHFNQNFKLFFMLKQVKWTMCRIYMAVFALIFSTNLPESQI